MIVMKIYWELECFQVLKAQSMKAPSQESLGHLHHGCVCFLTFVFLFSLSPVA